MKVISLIQEKMHSIKFIMQNSYACDSQVKDGDLGHGVRFHISLMIEEK